VGEGPIFDLFARPGDREDGRLNGLAGFALAATGLAILTVVPPPAMPVGVFVTAVLVLAYGNLGSKFVSTSSDDEFHQVSGFAAAGFLAGVLGQAAVAYVATRTVPFGAVPTYAFLAASGVVTAALLRSVLFERDDPLVMLSVGLLVWLLDVLVAGVGAAEVALALGITFLFGYAAYALDTASVTGMLSGVLLGLLTVVLGGLEWFAVMLTFFGVGGLSSKYRYDRKVERGVAEENEGARGSGNVLANATVALVAVVGFAASGHLPADGDLFRFAFAGSLAAAMSDTLSSEVGGLYDGPRLITTLEPVPPGTDGGVTWQGEVAGFAGALLVGGLAVVLLGLTDPVAGAVVVAGGLAGMTADSVLGATVEGDRVGNQLVNFAATFTGAVVSVALAVVL
jgi:uncharacterized protein (TIGR00297 family)